MYIELGLVPEQRRTITTWRNKCTSGCSTQGPPTTVVFACCNRTARDVQSQTGSTYRSSSGDTVEEWGNPLKCKVVNVSTTPISIFKGVSVATVYSVNNFDIPSTQYLILKPLSQPCSGNKRSVMRVLEREFSSTESLQQDNLYEANTGELSLSKKEALMEVRKDYPDVFAANPKTVSFCRWSPMKLELKNPNSAPYVAHRRHYTREKRKMIQTEVEKLHKAEAIVS